jgi:predicted deacylase
MSAIVHFLGRAFELAPYKLGQMIEAAPILDAQQARTAAIGERAGVAILPTDPADVREAKSRQVTAAMTTAEALQQAADAIRILHIGVARIDPSITVEAMLDDVDPTPDGINAIVAAMFAVLGHSGMTQGETLAPLPEPDGAGA